VREYGEIFDQRGEAYHRAMVEFPEAREAEFREIIRLADPRPGQVLCDVPSGGGYLQRYIRIPGCDVTAVETSEAFFRFCSERDAGRAVLSDLDHIALPSRSVDCVISLAGVHHLGDRAAFFREARRILRPGGTFCVADVKAGTATARFLNIFVNRFNSMGHEGMFFDEDAPAELEAVGFTVLEHYYRPYYWSFARIEDMCRYLTLLLGLDRATPEDVQAGVSRFLGYETANNACRMNWGLLFMRAVNPT
jgi:SAM-dependent methyltransferase